jgi:3-deoxy-7-phosphoheptulonate synthase
MTDKRIEDLNIISCSRLITPEEFKSELPASELASASVIRGRETVKDILACKDKRLFVVIGPCSIHDPVAAMDYGQRLQALAEQVQETLYLVMRVYFEKPRSTVGWKGLINDPHMNGSFEIEEGLHIARRLLLELAELAIGARTTESQTHREMSSGLSCTVGFKNGTDGGLTVAINALKSVSHPHSFLGINSEGQVSMVSTAGNKHGHIVLRGGNGRANYDSVNIATCEKELAKAGVCPYIMVDCSHENSQKDPALQPLVAENVTNQILEGNQSIIGLMIESNINFGNQSIPDNHADLQYGVSVTDGCIDWETTERCILDMHEKLKTLQ